MARTARVSASALYLAALPGTGGRGGRTAVAGLRAFLGAVASGAWPMDESFERLEPMLGFAES